MTTSLGTDIMIENILANIASRAYTLGSQVNHPAVFVIGERLEVAAMLIKTIEPYVANVVNLIPISAQHDLWQRSIRGRTAIAAIEVGCSISGEMLQSVRRSLRTTSEVTKTPIESMIYTLN